MLLYYAPYPATLTGWHLSAVVGGWLLAWGGAYAVLRPRLARGEVDVLLPGLIALLTGWGLLLQARLAPAMVLRQVLWLILACGVYCTATLTSGLTRVLRRYRYTLLTAGLLLLGATFVLGVNPSGYGQRLWLGAYGLYVQPSEPLKLLLVIYLATYLAEKRDLPAVKAAGQPMWLVVLGPMVAMVGISVMLLGWQRDLGAALLFYLTFVSMMYLAWGDLRYVVLSLVLFAPVGIAGYLFSDRVALRVSIWLNPWAPSQADRAFQILQSLFAFSAGGLAGQGLGHGSPGLIPAVHTDFVYAALVEEFGLAGGIGFLLLIAALIYRGIRLAQRADSAFESLLAGGIAALVGIQTWVIAGGNAKLIPITGVTLPFLSYGGSSLITMMAAMGLLTNLSTPHPAPLILSLTQDAVPPVRRTTVQLGQGLLVLLASVAVISGLWSVVRAPELRTYPTNPRFILSEDRIRRGRILDRNGEVLADIEIDAQGYVTRTYPVPEAAPVVGFATFAYGTDGIEAACDARLRGEVGQSAWDELKAALLHIDPVGRNVRLTIESRLQTLAQAQLQGHVGAAVLIDARTGDILALSSSPIYNSASIDEDWASLREQANSPFLNRATQGLAQPGTILQPFILASALQRDPEITPATPITRPVSFDGISVLCRSIAQEAALESEWQRALAAACPYPFVSLARDTGDEHVTNEFQKWGLLDAPNIVLPTVASDLTAEDLPLDAEAEALGQGDLLVTPLQMVFAVAALGNDGLPPTPKLLVEPLEGCALPTPEAPSRILDQETADLVRDQLPAYGDGIGHLGTSVAGPERRQSWFVGLNSATVPRYAVAVFIDQAEAPAVAAEIGQRLLTEVVNPQ
ncbi:MAG: FtsW/RodA/SpoVE family cell cycle protein [Anaerolineae bacterium]